MSGTLLQTLGEGKVYFPMGKILRESSNRTEAFILFEATEKQFITLPPKTLRQAIANGYDIRGFASGYGNCSMLGNSYFRNLRIFNNASSKPQWLVFMKEIVARETFYRLISEDNEEKRMTREELVDFINDGNEVLGTKKLNGKVIITSSIIVRVNGGAVCKNKFAVKKLPRATDLDKMMQAAKNSI